MERIRSSARHLCSSSHPPSLLIFSICRVFPRDVVVEAKRGIEEPHPQQLLQFQYRWTAQTVTQKMSRQTPSSPAAFARKTVAPKRDTNLPRTFYHTFRDRVGARVPRHSRRYRHVERKRVHTLDRASSRPADGGKDDGASGAEARTTFLFRWCGRNKRRGGRRGIGKLIDELLMSHAEVGAEFVTPYNALCGTEEAFADDEGWYCGGRRRRGGGCCGIILFGGMLEWVWRG